MSRLKQKYCKLLFINLFCLLINHLSIQWDIFSSQSIKLSFSLLLSYKQQKFNLFREESEGYSKLVAELGHESLTGVSPNAVLDSIKSLIGQWTYALI